MDWTSLPIQPVPVERIVFPCHDLDPDHVHGIAPDLTTGPIHLQQLLDGDYFVHDGRHRTLRARLRGDTHIEARVHA